MAVSFNQRVVGSIPTALTNKIKDLAKSVFPRKRRWVAHGEHRGCWQTPAMTCVLLQAGAA
jgi:hypothetical protein